jgi:hypothetical protein
MDTIFNSVSLLFTIMLSVAVSVSIFNTLLISFRFIWALNTNIKLLYFCYGPRGTNGISNKTVRTRPRQAGQRIRTSRTIG